MRGVILAPVGAWLLGCGAVDWRPSVEEAKLHAAASGKPLLVLSVLGDLKTRC